MEEFASTSFRNNELRSSVCTFQGLSVSIVLLRCTVRMIHLIMFFCEDDDNSLEIPLISISFEYLLYQ